MNKKIIAIAIAAAMTAPVAMADVKVGGQIGAALTQNDDGAGNTSRGMSDNGLSKLEFSGKAGDAFFKIGIDIRNIITGAAGVTKAAGESNGEGLRGRDFSLGYKFGASSISAGRMPAALAGLEGDKYNATFLELRRTAAVSTTEKTSTDTYYKSPILQFATKAGGATIKVQYDAADKSASSATEGYYAASVKGKGGPVGYFAGVNNGNGTETGNADEQNIKAGASMKFGAANVTLMVMNSTKDSVKASSTAITADIGVGSGMSVGVGYGMQNSGAANKDTFMRLALTKNLSKGAALFGGYAAKHDDDGNDSNALGFGMKIKF